MACPFRSVPRVVALLAAAVTAVFAEAPEDPAGAMSRGVALLEQFRFSEAAAEFERVVAGRSESAAAHVNLGIARFNERDFEASRDSFVRALDLDPGDLHAHYNLGLIEKLEGNTEAALLAFERVAEADSDDSMTQYYLGAAYATLGRLGEAEHALRRAIRLQPNHESAHFSLGNVLVRAGRRDEGREWLARFQELREAFSGVGVSAGLQYTELGPYAEAIEEDQPSLHAGLLASGQTEPAPSGAARFTESSRRLGLGLEPLEAAPEAPATISPGDYSASWFGDFLRPRLGAGVALRDLDADGRPEIVFVRGGALFVFRNTGAGFERWEDPGFEVEDAVSATIGDLDSDGDPDIYIAAAGPNSLLLNRFGEPGPAFTPAEGSGTEGGEVSASATLADFDHDGDLDIQVSNYAPGALSGPAAGVRVPEGIPGAPNRLYRNNGNGSFTDVAAATGTAGDERKSLFSLFSDWDDDRDVDFLVVNDESPVQAFSNDRLGGFTESAQVWGIETAARMRGAASADYDRDGFFDLALTAEGGALNSLLRGPPDPAFSPDLAFPSVLGAGVPNARYGISFLDADHDLDLDLLLVTGAPDAPLAYYENGPSGFTRTAGLTAALEPGEAVRALALGDLDGDGDLDAVAGTTRGRLLAFSNDHENAGNWLRVQPRGLRSNLDAVGAKVEVRVFGISQRREVRTTSGYLSQDDAPVHVGLGTATAADYIRFLWPGGVKQIELDVPALEVASIEELNRKGTSCPVLYAWDGERVRFVTDFLGGSALGNLLAPGVFNTPDTDEVVKFESFPLVPREGFFDLRFVNQLEEVIFYDRAALWVADHPEDVDVFPRERLLPGPPYEEPGLIAVRNRISPSEAVFSSGSGPGRDVTRELARADRRHVDGFALLPFKGYAEPHILTLSFGGARSDAEQVLLLHGWVDYADSSSNLAASQAGVRAEPPVLDVFEGGRFRTAVDRMGFPAGLPKTMVVPLGDTRIAPGQPLRIRTNMRIHWDRIELAEVAEGARVQEWRLDPESATLRFVGYPEPHRPLGLPPTEYRYGSRAARDVWGAHEGSYTRYGEVLPLLEAVDDRVVITRHGDEVRLRFDAREVPPAVAGTRRSFFVFADGFGKDMDLNSARPDTVGPLPFHSMPGYPYPEGAWPASPELERWQAKWNTRSIGPEGPRGFLGGETPSEVTEGQEDRGAAPRRR